MAWQNGVTRRRGQWRSGEICDRYACNAFKTAYLSDRTNRCQNNQFCFNLVSWGYQMAWQDGVARWRGQWRTNRCQNNQFCFNLVN